MKHSHGKQQTSDSTCATDNNDKMVSCDLENNVLFSSNGKNFTVSSINNDDNLESNQCGLCAFKPAFLQSFANKKAFIVVFCLTSVVQGMFYTYFVSALTTIEKLYQIQSTTTGLLMSAAEIGRIAGVLVLTYYGGRGNRPKWIAFGMLAFSFAVLLASSPHFLLNDHHYNYPHSLKSSSSFDRSSSPLTSSSDLSFMKNKLCNTNDSNSYFEYDFGHASTSVRDPDPTTFPPNSSCSSSNLNYSPSRRTKTVLGIFFVSVLLVGIGSTTTNTLGIPYIDDNVAPGESPLYFGITIGIKIFGPVFGFLLGSICTNIYVDFPSNSSTLTPSDPQWIGAWWLGMVIIGFALIIVSFMMMSFPKSLPKSLANKSQLKLIAQQKYLNKSEDSDLANENHIKYQIEPMLKSNQDLEENNHSKSLPQSDKLQTSTISSVEVVKPSLRDFPTTLKRLLDNKILLLQTASSVLHLLPIAGIYTFLPKYLESQFQLTASNANAITGIAGILIMGAGIFSSSIFIQKYKPSPRFVALWIAISALIYCIGMIILMTIGCSPKNFVGLNSRSSLSDSCESKCLCSNQFLPVCAQNSINYLSPCSAGCTKVSLNQSTYIFSDCQCVGPSVTATSGFCPSSCTTLPLYIFVFTTIVLVHSTREVGSMLLTLRCVEQKDKAMALGFMSFAIGLFGNVPCPIIYGYVVDWSCIFWEEICGKRGACRLYDPFQFRISFHGLTAFIIFLAFIVDMVVWCKAGSIRFDDDFNDDKSVHLEIPVKHAVNDNELKESESPNQS